MKKLIFLFCYYWCIYIVQTNDYTLHFLFNSGIQSVKLPLLQQQLPAIQDNTSKSESTSVTPSSKEYVDNIVISSNGIIYFEDIEIGIDSILNHPRIYKNIIFQTNKTCATVSIFNIVIFIVNLDVFIIDSRTLYTRKHTVNYIYYPFTSSKNMSVCGECLVLDGKNYSFDCGIVAVYDTKFFGGSIYMNRIYSSSEIVPYQSKVVEKNSFMLSPFLLIFSIIVYYLLKKNIIKDKKLYENSKYILYKGKYNKEECLIKIYKDSNQIKDLEINKLAFRGVPLIKYHEKTVFKSMFIFNYSEILKLPTKEDLKQIVDCIYNLHKNNISYKYLNPSNVRKSNDTVYLFNILGNEELDEWYFNYKGRIDHKYDDFQNDIFMLGNLLHYYITGHHPFETEKQFIKKDVKSLEDNKEKFIFCKSYEKEIESDSNEGRSQFSDKKINNSNDVVSNSSNDDVKCKRIDNTEEYIDVDLKDVSHKEYTPQDLEDIEKNMILRNYKIRCLDPLKHDLIYHSIKKKVETRTSIDKLRKHPYFWSAERIFTFLAHYSDILEGTPSQVRKLERNKKRIFTKPWNTYLEELIKEELQVFRIYNYNSAKDLIRVIRNKGRHYNQIPLCVKAIYDTFPKGFISYWCSRFPWLLIVCYNCGESLKENELLKDFY